MMSIAASIQADQEPRRFREMREMLAMAAMEAASRVFHVNEYETDQAYGGPQEGGWWYPCGRFIRCHGAVATLEEAEALRSDLEEYVREANEGRAPGESTRTSPGVTRGNRTRGGEDFRSPGRAGCCGVPTASWCWS